MKQELKIGIAGLGIVGSGVYEILTEELELINKRSKKLLKITAVSSRTKKDFIDYSKVKNYADPLELADDEAIDIIVELIGGSEGVAYELCKKSLNNKKHFVTANKAMIAIHGAELAKIAEKNNVALCFEASVAGAIPILKTLKEGLSANQISKIYAILNGTCNYILTKMEENNSNFGVALKEAQKLGYAESDPTFDIEGVDTAHKLAILTAIAKNSKTDFNKIYIEGISKIGIEDIKFAAELGYRIKLLGIFEDLGNGKIKQSVYPALINKSEKIATVNDSFNAILSYGNNCDWNFCVGRGAGSKTTASAVVADLIDIANDRISEAFGCEIANLSSVKTALINERIGEYYLRFHSTKDFAKTNFLKEIFKSEILEKCLIEELSDGNVAYALKINEISEDEMNSYLKKIENLSEINNVNLIRVEICQI